jgi:hypothetical protein
MIGRKCGLLLIDLSKKKHQREMINICQSRGKWVDVSYQVREMSVFAIRSRLDGILKHLSGCLTVFLRGRCLSFPQCKAIKSQQTAESRSLFSKLVLHMLHLDSTPIMYAN